MNARTFLIINPLFSKSSDKLLNGMNCRQRTLIRNCGKLLKFSMIKTISKPEPENSVTDNITSFLNDIINYVVMIFSKDVLLQISNSEICCCFLNKPDVCPHN